MKDTDKRIKKIQKNLSFSEIQRIVLMSTAHTEKLFQYLPKENLHWS